MKSEEKINKFLDELEPFLILVIICSFVGVVGGALGALFLKTIDVFTAFRTSFKYLVFAMPLVGLVIVYINKKYKCAENESEVVNKAMFGEDLPNHTVPSLFITTCLSHLVGASVGKLEAPIGMGGSIGNYISNFFGLKSKYRRTVIASGVSALFGCIFGTPVMGTVFSLELCYSKDNKKPIFILPVLLSACFSRFICFAFGINSFVDRILYIHHANYGIKDIFFILVLIIICLSFGLIFNYIFDFVKNLFSKIKNEYIRIIIGSLIMIGAFCLINNTLFLGNDTSLIKKSMVNNHMWYSFIVKTILTALCASIGFKGGKIGPAFVVGCCLGILLANFMGIDPIMGACIGSICLMGCVTTFYISNMVLGIELFGFKSIVFYIIIAIAIKYFVNNGYIKRTI